MGDLIAEYETYFRKPSIDVGGIVCFVARSHWDKP
jgi:hypothetical protein